MNPNQPYVPPPSNNPYDFILNPSPKPKKGFGGLMRDKLIRTLVFVLGGTFIFMIVVAIALNSFGGGNQVNTNDMVSLGQSQTELIRVARQGSSASRQGTRALATTVEYTMKTQLQQTTALLAENDRKLGDKELTLKQNANTDQQFKASKATSTFDLVYAQVMEKQLQTYSRELQSTLNKSSNSDERELLSSYNQQVQLLLTQIPFTQKDILDNQ
jgi:hypothetical protein